MSRNFRFVKKQAVRKGVTKRTEQLRTATAALRAAARRPAPARMQLAPELKFYDTALASTTVAAAVDATGGEYDPSATSMISTPAVGDSEQNREGKRIQIKNCYIKGTISHPGAELAAAPPAPNKVYVALVLDTQSNGAQLNSEDVYKNLAGNVQTNPTPLRNLLFGSRFRVLKDEVIDMNLTGISHFAVDSFSNAGKEVEFEWFVPLNNMIVNFNAGTTASIANVVDNSLHIIAFATAATTTISYNARIRFVG